MGRAYKGGGAGEQRGRGAEEQGSRGAEGQRSRGAEGQRSRGAEEQRGVSQFCRGGLPAFPPGRKRPGSGKDEALKRLSPPWQPAFPHGYRGEEGASSALGNLIPIVLVTAILPDGKPSGSISEAPFRG